MRLWCLPVLLMCVAGRVAAGDLDTAAVAAFVDEMVAKHGFERTEVQRVMSRAERSDRILKTMSRPAEKAKPWHEYRKVFLTRERIDRGLEFWRANAESLAQAYEKYGVPPEIVVAIIGVETAYGRITGSDSVVDALATLAFHYPSGNERRMHFFREQLRHLFLLCREHALDPLELTGSYAGAMGIPQFMPESYRKYAVDFNDDGRSDIWNDRADAIGSVANYLHTFGWKRDRPVVLAARTDAATAKPLLVDNMKPHTRLGEYASKGVATDAAEPDELAALFELEGEAAPEFWLGLTNFYAIMKYNPRTKYAMAVYQLAEAIRQARAQPGS